MLLFFLFSLFVLGLKLLTVQRGIQPHWVSNYWNQIDFQAVFPLTSIFCGVRDDWCGESVPPSSTPLERWPYQGQQRNSGCLGYMNPFLRLLQSASHISAPKESRWVWVSETVGAHRWAWETSHLHACRQWSPSPRPGAPACVNGLHDLKWQACHSLSAAIFSFSTVITSTASWRRSKHFPAISCFSHSFSGNFMEKLRSTI